MVENIGLMELPSGLCEYLRSLPMEGKDEIPVYYRNNKEEVFFVSDFILRDVKTFEKTAVSGLYRGGGLLRLRTKNGQVVIYDDRYKWFRLIGGIAHYSEGSDLFKTAVRESVVEELSVLTKNENFRLVPKGFKSFVKTEIPGWGITVKDVVETGSLFQLQHFFNDDNKSFEVVVEWDLSNYNNGDFIILHNEDWFRGGRSGFTPFVINETGLIVGLYDGRHGYVPMSVQAFHPTLKACL